MRVVGRSSWELLKQHAAVHLENPLWLGGSFCINREVVADRPALPTGPWEALIQEHRETAGRAS
jgi:hypothetical protein